jgi:hypothetical protein
MLVLLGEVGGVEEYRVIEAVKSGVITKPVVAWAIGTCASMFKTEVQFGHAGSFANSQLETAAMKNKSMKEAGIFVPDTFEEMPELLSQVYKTLSSRVRSSHSQNQCRLRFPSTIHGLRSWDLFANPLLSFRPSPMTVGKNFCTQACQSRTSSERRLVLVV